MPLKAVEETAGASPAFFPLPAFREAPAVSPAPEKLVSGANEGAPTGRFKIKKTSKPD
jgi:hypothetical protein